jgi:TPR repeat protein
LSLSFFGEFYLNGKMQINVTPTVSAAPVDLCAAAESHWKSAEAVGSIAAFEDHLARFPNCSFAGLAKARIESLKNQVAVVAPPVPPAAPLITSDEAVRLAREAARLYKLSADRGNADGQWHLGSFYRDGRGGLPKDDRKAAQLFKLSADQGNSMGEVDLADFYASGRGGLARDDRKAARLYRLAADKGNGWGQMYLGSFYRDGRGGLPQDDHKAARLFKLSADQGIALGEVDLADFYGSGRGGVPKDDGEAVRLYKLAADQGNAQALDNLASLLRKNNR